MANLTTQNLAIAKLYTALFNRAPDAAGFAFWAQALANGASLDTLAQTMMTAPEALALYPAGQTSAQFVTAYYTSVFGRAPDAGGLAFWSAALDAQGGAGNGAARAALTLQISTIASTPLASKPEGMSDTAYAQTVADRARFINKTEFGVYFATELKSNDLSVAKAALSLVTDAPASATAAQNFAAYGGAVSTPPPVLALTSANSVADIGVKIAAYTGTTGTVDATGMDAAQLGAIATGSAKLAAGGITGVLAVSSAINDVDLATLFGKYAGMTAAVAASGMSQTQLAAVAGAPTKIAPAGITGMTLLLGDAAIEGAVAGNLLGKAGGALVTATNATAAEVSALAANLTNVAANGISGTLAIGNALADADITALFGKYAGTTATVAASGMNQAQLAAVAGVSTKLAPAGITGMTLLLGDAAIAGTVAATLLANASGALVTATDATTAEVSALVANLANVAANGISGTLAISNALSDTDITALFGKYAGTTATVTASSMDTARLAAVAAATTKIATDGILGNMSLSTSQSDLQIAALLAKTSVDANVQVSAASMDAPRLNAVANGIAKVDGITSMTMNLSAFSDTAVDALLSKASGALVSMSADLSSAVVSSVMNNLANLADHSFGAGMTITTAQLGTKAALLQQKLSSAELKIAGDASNNIIDLAPLNDVAIMHVNGGAGADRILFSGVAGKEQRVFVASQAETRADPHTTDTTTDNFDTIGGLNLNTYIRFSTAANQFGDSLTLNIGSINVAASTSIGSAATMADVLAAANGLTPVASSSGGGGAKLYVVTVTGGGSTLAGHSFAILNDQSAEITIDDTIVAIVGTSISPSVFEAGPSFGV